MKKVLFALALGLALNTTAGAIEIAISTHANWWSQAAADRETQLIADSVEGATVRLFDATHQADLAGWVREHTEDGAPDILILCGRFPASIYPSPNVQPEGSLAELFLDAGNCIINTGDYIFYMSNAGTNNTAAGLRNMMDLPGISMGTAAADNNQAMTITADGRKYTPSLDIVTSDRPIPLNLLAGDWDPELILAQNAAGTRADPVIVRNRATGGRLGIFYQAQNEDNDPRGKVISEWINNWYLPLIVGNTKLAGKPAPADEATDIPFDTGLGWQSGQYAATHDVYLGLAFADVSTATRTDPKGVLAAQGQAQAAFRPAASLDFGQTYYWRVDEVNGPPDNTIFKGQVWSFTVEPYAYPVKPAAATASSFQAGMGPEKTIDGSGLTGDLHGTDTATMWMSIGTQPNWIQYEFDGVYKLHQLQVWNSNQMTESILGFGAKSVTLETSTDGATWTPVADVPEFAKAPGAAGYAANTTVNLGEVEAKYIKLTINSNWGGLVPTTSLAEVRFLSVPVRARAPEPANGATEVSIEAPLAWRPGREATSHTVYLGTDPNAVAGGTVAAKTVADHSFTPDSLNYGTTYYWKVDEVNAATYPGNVWSFTTQQYQVIDDFESYTDQEGEAVYQTWLDGYADKSHGASTVGLYPDPINGTYCETTIIHGGKQSMPLTYDNTAAPYYSETLRTFDTPQDWTIHGIKSMSLWFQGADGNAGQLYVKINNTKIAYDGDAADLARPAWQVWNIDLSQAGNVNSVRSLALGIDGTGAKGTLYFDDIRLYPKAPEFIIPVPPAATALVGYYTLDEGSGTRAADTSGKGHDGTILGNPQWSAGVVGGALTVDGDGDWVDLGNPADWPAGTAARSLCAWAKTDTLATGWHWIATYGSPANSQAMFIGSNGTTLYGGGYGNDVLVSGFWATGVWHHIALTYDGTTARLYADGVEVVSAAKTWNLVRSQARIGQQVNALSEFWKGTIDDVRVYGRALSPAEVAGLAGQTKPRHKPF